jgi:hypothetical protein
MQPKTIQQAIRQTIYDVCANRSELATAIIDRIEQPDADGQTPEGNLVDDALASIARGKARHPWDSSPLSVSEVEEAGLDNWLRSYREEIMATVEQSAGEGVAL